MSDRWTCLCGMGVNAEGKNLKPLVNHYPVDAKCPDEAAAATLFTRDVLAGVTENQKYPSSLYVFVGLNDGPMQAFMVHFDRDGVTSADPISTEGLKVAGLEFCYGLECPEMNVRSYSNFRV